MHEFGITPSARVFRKLLPAYECSNKDEFYSKLGSEIINLDEVETILRQDSKNKVLKFWDIQFTNPFKSGAGKGSDTHFVGSHGNEGELRRTRFVIADCNPIPGDNIVGYRDPATNTIVVHKAGCEEITRLAAQKGDNIVTNIKWSSYKAESYLSEIEIRGIDRTGMLMDIAQVVTVESGINIRKLSIQSHDGIFEGNLSVYVKDIDNLNTLIDKVRHIKGIDIVKRIKAS
jgi:GTP pyrophosphokinase